MTVDAKSCLTCHWCSRDPWSPPACINPNPCIRHDQWKPATDIDLSAKEET